MTVAPPSGSTVLATIYTLIALAAVIIGARIYLRLKIQRHRLLASDYFMIAAWCSAVSCASVNVVMKVHGALEPERDYDFSTLDEDPKVIDVSRVITRPIEECDPKWLPLIFQVAWGLHFFGSLQLFLLPFSIFHDLKMNKRTKRGVYGVFLIGLIDLIFSLTRFLNVQLGDHNGFRSITMIELWSALDAYIGLIVACLPSLRPLLRRDIATSNKYTGESSGRIPRPVRTDDNEFQEIEDIESVDSRGAISTI
ncbi:hypothetical protein CEP51_000143 [Fusarium floridanum]|uniref:Rhodopsin domain-containing protein n=1 Tax=Fusarium floridanum TaxID=1325733 RepID=A0A428SPS8_9HYPO|nr:hypothetical protein CEP51_000143 [Fusarium floridanum]